VTGVAEHRIVTAQTEGGTRLARQHRVLGDPGTLLGIISLVMAHRAQVGAAFVALRAHGAILLGDHGVAGRPACPTLRMRHHEPVTGSAEILAVTHRALLPIRRGDLPVQRQPVTRLVRTGTQIKSLEMAQVTAPGGLGSLGQIVTGEALFHHQRVPVPSGIEMSRPPVARHA